MKNINDYFSQKIVEGQGNYNSNKMGPEQRGRQSFEAGIRVHRRPDPSQNDVRGNVEESRVDGGAGGRAFGVWWRDRSSDQSTKKRRL